MERLKKRVNALKLEDDRHGLKQNALIEKVLEVIENTAPAKQIVYICSPYRGEVIKNERLARVYCRKAVLMGGVIPIAPHLYLTQFLNDADTKERELGLSIGIELLKLCDELWVFGDVISKGMQAEIDFAVGNSIHIAYFPQGVSL